MSGASELASLEQDHNRLLVCNAADVAEARAELLAAGEIRRRVLLLYDWLSTSPQATSQLLRVIARDPSASVDLAPAVLATRGIEDEDLDDVLVSAFRSLTGAWREAAADRKGVQQRCGLAPDPRTSVGPPDPSWLWPVGKTFPPADTVEGVQARLNYLELGAGPVNGQWTDLTRRAFVRWQVLNGLEPTGELDYSATERMAAATPSAPE